MVDAAKQAIRERVWDDLERSGVARFPRPIVDRIPNFVGADQAAERAAALAPWRRAEVLKANPDSPQAPLRRLALEDGKVLYMAVPRLREARCFVRLDPRRIRETKAAASIRGALRLGEPTHPKDLPRIDLVVAGAVAVNTRGARIGKGGGYSDLEFALARHFHAVGEATPVLTTVHTRQVLAEDLPMRPHDEPVDLIALPDRVIHADPGFPKPKGILWNLLGEEQVAAIPILRELRGPATGRSA